MFKGKRCASKKREEGVTSGQRGELPKKRGGDQRGKGKVRRGYDCQKGRVNACRPPPYLLWGMETLVPKKKKDLSGTRRLVRWLRKKSCVRKYFPAERKRKCQKLFKRRTSNIKSPPRPYIQLSRGKGGGALRRIKWLERPWHASGEMNRSLKTLEEKRISQ